MMTRRDLLAAGATLALPRALHAQSAVFDAVQIFGGRTGEMNVDADRIGNAGRRQGVGTRGREGKQPEKQPQRAVGMGKNPHGGTSLCPESVSEV